MKNLFSLFCILISCNLSAQNISGFYSGKLVNDSTKKEQQYELALSEYRGNITGYAYTTFIVNDTFYYSVKRVKAQRNNGVLIVEDVKMLGNNFPQAPDKGVRQIMHIPLNEQDSITEIKGTWKTTQTKRFYSIGGDVDMRREKDSSRLALVHHLYDIGEWKRPVYQDAQKEQPLLAKKSPTTNDAAQEDIGIIKVVKPEDLKPKVLAYTERKELQTQQFAVEGDSLLLSFYDNGTVDGDSISVYLNGAPIISNVRLSAAAARKTIQLDKAMDVYKLVLVAENLGTIPPNTGLLVIQDGSNRYQVNFTADLQTNAAIELKRKDKK